ncbi:MAG: RNA-dependent DNA polymerase [Proteobacteria bacterium]|nr:RNA-dependent DNA polymerase [Pseudomonadota bacterium]
MSAKKWTSIPDDFDIVRASREEVRKLRWSPVWQDFLLREVVRMGFYEPEDDTEQSYYINRSKELRAELQKLNIEIEELKEEESSLVDQRKAIAKATQRQKEAHRVRLDESRAQRQVRKQQRIEQRKAKKELWSIRKQQELLYIGAGVSRILKERNSDTAKLKSLGCPVVLTDLELLSLLQQPASEDDSIELSMAHLRRFAFRRRISQHTNYTQFTIPKKTGGERLITAPTMALKTVQRRIVKHILSTIPTHSAAHGFVEGRSIRSNAEPHTQSAIVVNMDLKDFFPTITGHRVRGLFQSFGYSPAISAILAFICTRPDVSVFELDGQNWYFYEGKDVLPQGSPASPMISNLICRKLDRRLEGLAQSTGFTYTRYADDLTFSSSDPDASVGALLHATRAIVADEQFEVHPSKTRIMRNGSCKEVTGVVVNEYPNISRARLRRFRALLHQLKTKGLENAHWEETTGPALLNKALGFAAHIKSVSQPKGAEIFEETLEIINDLKGQ